jgi:hypothetical protein
MVGKMIFQLFFDSGESSTERPFVHLPIL